jgi:hypothetical protein
VHLAVKYFAANDVADPPFLVRIRVQRASSRFFEVDGVEGGGGRTYYAARLDGRYRTVVGAIFVTAMLNIRRRWGLAVGIDELGNPRYRRALSAFRLLLLYCT